MIPVFFPLGWFGPIFRFNFNAPKFPLFVPRGIGTAPFLFLLCVVRVLRWTRCGITTTPTSVATAATAVIIAAAAVLIITLVVGSSSCGR